ncbi:hypothetical protein C0J52_05731, partial [Blattella germanica]
RPQHPHLLSQSAGSRFILFSADYSHCFHKPPTDIPPSRTPHRRSRKPFPNKFNILNILAVTYLTYSESIEILNRTHKFQAVCGCINRTLRNKTRKDTQLRFYNTIALAQLLYGSETWTHRRKDINKIEASEMRLLLAVKGCTRLDKLRSADIRTELKITESAVDKVQKYKTN